MNGEKVGKSKYSACTKARCGGVILADTEDWKKPLCHYHYQKRCFESIDMAKKEAVLFAGEPGQKAVIYKLVEEKSEQGN